MDGLGFSLLIVIDNGNGVFRVHYLERLRVSFGLIVRMSFVDIPCILESKINFTQHCFLYG